VPLRRLEDRQQVKEAAGRGMAVVAMAADDDYSMQLAAAARSLINNLGPGRGLLLFVVSSGVAGPNREKILKSWETPKDVAVSWVEIDPASLGGMNVSGHVSAATYSRVFIPRLLPPFVNKAIYLDSDLLVLRDISGLWDKSMEGVYALAARDIMTPYFCSREALKDRPRCLPYLFADVPVKDYRELGIPGTAKYFNAGVMVMDLDKWRSDRIGEAALDYLEKNKGELRYWDQDGLNAVLAGKWGELDPRWNQLAHIYRFPSWKESPLDRDTFDKLLNDPYIIHFASRSKPWYHDNCHPARSLYFRCLDMTEWKGWRPEFTLWGAFRKLVYSLKPLRMAGIRLKAFIKWILFVKLDLYWKFRRG